MSGAEWKRAEWTFLHINHCREFSSEEEISFGMEIMHYVFLYDEDYMMKYKKRDCKRISVLGTTRVDELNAAYARWFKIAFVFQRSVSIRAGPFLYFSYFTHTAVTAVDVPERCCLLK